MHQEKVTSEATTFGRVLPGVLGHKSVILKEGVEL